MVPVMNEAEYKEMKARFLKVAANVPMPLRKEIIAVIDNQSITWAVAKEEIDRNTKNAKSILEQLKQLGVI